MPRPPRRSHPQALLKLAWEDRFSGPLEGHEFEKTYCTYFYLGGSMMKMRSAYPGCRSQQSFSPFANAGRLCQGQQLRLLMNLEAAEPRGIPYFTHICPFWLPHEPRGLLGSVAQVLPPLPLC